MSDGGSWTGKYGRSSLVKSMSFGENRGIQGDSELAGNEVDGGYGNLCEDGT